MARSEQKKDQSGLSGKALETVRDALSKGWRVELIPVKNGVIVTRIRRDTIFESRNENNAPP